MSEKDKVKLVSTEKRKAEDGEPIKDLKKVRSIFTLYKKKLLSKQETIYNPI